MQKLGESLDKHMVNTKKSFSWIRKMENHQARVTVQVGFSQPLDPSWSLRLSIGEPEIASHVCAPKGATCEWTVVLEKPRLWSAEKPNLYDMTLQLLDEKGASLERIDTRIGLREVTIENGVLKLNGVPIKLVGICRHDVHPDRGTAVGKELWRRDLQLMREAKIKQLALIHLERTTRRDQQPALEQILIQQSALFLPVEGDIVHLD